jgi:malate dehydrogenase (oxaloacetate-decarboxylating)(NADP+)
MRERNHFGAMMVEMGDADAMISGLTRNYRRYCEACYSNIGLQKDVNIVSGMYILVTKKALCF